MAEKDSALQIEEATPKLEDQTGSRGLETFLVQLASSG